MHSILTRRRLILAGAALPVLAGGAYLVAAQGGPSPAIAMTPPEVRDAVAAGDVVLIDIRRPDEWASTGVAEGAVPIDMRRSDFVAAVLAARGDSDRPVAVICAAGVRSRRMSSVLAEAGVTEIIDVPEGMMGSRAGPGWLERGLPVVTPQ